MSSKTRTYVLLAIMALSLPGRALAWWNDDWAFRKQINLDLSPTGANIAQSAAEVPLLIRLHPGNFSYFGDVQANGADLRFVAADDVTPLKFHIERFDAVNQIALLWVRIPRLTGGTSSDYVYLYYGNPSAAPAGDPAGTYDANQALVYHFSGEPGGQPSDATAYGNDPSSSDVDLASAALIAGGAAFDGASGIDVPAAPSLRIVPEQGVTVSAWVRVGGPQQDAYLVSADSGQGAALVLGIDGLAPYARLASADSAPVSVAAADLTLDEWHHVALRAGGGRLALWVDGREAAGMEASLPEIDAPFVVGRSTAGEHGFVGELDELEVSNTARPAAWIEAASGSQGLFATLVVYGGDAQREAGGGQSYFAVTLRNVTVDGWVVIALLGVMFAVSMIVIVGKTLLLSRVERQNRRFLAEYRALGGGDPLALAGGTAAAADEADTAAQAFEASTLYPLFLAGVDEIRHRLQSPAVGAQRRGFTAETIGAIRATVDAVLVRQRQKLNAQMVLLTIAISGGPFLGLLGTVVGVMVTFAAIAAAGDVNVNAIAPGIAAALVATVAGLGVAIPSMFAYNWLGTRIRDIDAETHVFADEFVNKLAEHYV